MDCSNCKGTGKTTNSKGTVLNCWECDGTGEKCDNCGESSAVCNGYECLEEPE